METTIFDSFLFLRRMEHLNLTSLLRVPVMELQLAVGTLQPVVVLSLPDLGHSTEVPGAVPVEQDTLEGVVGGLVVGVAALL